MYLCSNELQDMLNKNCKHFKLPETIFTCNNCKEKYGSCEEENRKREENGEELLCNERFHRYYQEEEND